MEKKKISEKVTLIRNDDGLQIEIDQKVSSLKFFLIILWFVVVLVAGFMIIPDFLKLPSNWSSIKVFYSVVLAGWLFFLFKIGKIIVWRYMGREVISLFDGEFSINNMYGTVGKPQKFIKKNINKFKVYAGANDLLKKYVDYEFLTTGGEKFEFAYLEKEYIFGKTLNEKEILILERILRKELKKK